MRVHFYDVAEGLAALVDLPDGRHILVDTGDEPNHPGFTGTPRRKRRRCCQSVVR